MLAQNAATAEVSVAPSQGPYSKQQYQDKSLQDCYFYLVHWETDVQRLTCSLQLSTLVAEFRMETWCPASSPALSAEPEMIEEEKGASNPRVQTKIWKND